MGRVGGNTEEKEDHSHTAEFRRNKAAGCEAKVLRSSAALGAVKHCGWPQMVLWKNSLEARASVHVCAADANGREKEQGA